MGRRKERQFRPTTGKRPRMKGGDERAHLFLRHSNNYHIKYNECKIAFSSDPESSEEVSLGKPPIKMSKIGSGVFRLFLGSEKILRRR
jgi:hypothetical protein